ncbi:MAG: TIGR03086 family metal-binding protein, partial [Propionibacteriaceae bacterium]
MTTTLAPLEAAWNQLTEVADAVSPDFYDHPTPCADWSVAQVLEHATLDQLIWAAVVTGQPGPDGDAFAPTGTFASSPAELVAPAVRAALDAWRVVEPEARAVATPLPQGEMPLAVAVRACALDAAVHAWDIAVGIGRPSPLTPDLASELLPVARGFVEPLRAYGVFAAALEPVPGDDTASELLRYLGRDPHWA